jgi:hypothetical protein
VAISQMSFSPAFLHGEQVLVGLGLAALITLIVIPLLLYFWLWHTKISELQLATAYFILMAVVCGSLAFSTSNPTSIFQLTVVGLGFLLTLPWNLLAGWLFSLAINTGLSDRQLAVVMLLGAAINAVLLYFAAIKMRRIIGARR